MHLLEVQYNAFEDKESIIYYLDFENSDNNQCIFNISFNLISKLDAFEVNMSVTSREKSLSTFQYLDELHLPKLISNIMMVENVRKKGLAN